MPYETIEHAADIGIRVTAKNLRELFRESAAAMTTPMTDSKTPAGRETVAVNVEGEEWVDLPINGLRVAAGNSLPVARAGVAHGLVGAS